MPEKLFYSQFIDVYATRSRRNDQFYSTDRNKIPVQAKIVDDQVK